MGGLERLYRKGLEKVDTVKSLNPFGEGSVIVDTHVLNNKQEVFRVERHLRRGSWGLLIYPDGTVCQAQSGDIFYRKRQSDNLVDRVVAGKPPSGHLFISQNNPLFEIVFRERVTDRLTESGPKAHGTMFIGPIRVPPIPPLSPEAYSHLLDLAGHKPT